LRDHQNDSPNSDPAVVPMMKPKMVERKVKLMSVQASPVVKKMLKVWAIALGCDQKKASIQPVRAAISQSEIAPTRIPTCAVISAQAGQSLCTGSRRAGFAAAGTGAESPCASSRRAISPRVELS
jgi:hypothetical protein